MLYYNELRPGHIILLDKQPWVVLQYEFLRMQQRKPVSRTKLRNLITGAVREHTFHQNDRIAEAEVERKEIKFVYSSRGEYWFNDPKDAAKRFSLKENQIMPSTIYLRPGMIITAVTMDGEIILAELPIKAEYKIIEAEPAVKGNTVHGGTKTVTIEGGAKVAVPMFVNEGDTIRVNTETGEYVERVSKA
jgi:elongation factor P